MSGCSSEKVQARDFTRYSWKAEVVAGLPFAPWKIPCKCSSLTLPVPQWKCGTHVPFCLSKSPLWSVSLKKTERLPLLQDKPSGSWCCSCKYRYGWIWSVLRASDVCYSWFSWQNIWSLLWEAKSLQDKQNKWEVFKGTCLYWTQTHKRCWVGPPLHMPHIW